MDLLPYPIAQNTLGNSYKNSIFLSLHEHVHVSAHECTHTYMQANRHKHTGMVCLSVCVHVYKLPCRK